MFRESRTRQTILEDLQIMIKNVSENEKVDSNAVATQLYNEELAQESLV